MYKMFGKRLLDVVISLVLLLITSPIVLFSTLFLYFTNNGKPFFFQTRPGKDEKLFKIIKFKTMNDKKDIHGNLLPDNQRMTKIGNWVRKSSIDELPQLLNVLFGQMSLIGPRPLLTQYLTLYSTQQKRRHSVKPGITGWAQINGRNAISWKQKFEYDIEYVDKLSFKFDFLIVYKTFKKVIFKEDINKKGQVTTDYFNGSN